MEYVRHRVMSFAQESTRYCNYSKDKFDNHVTFILPCWLDDKHLHDNYAKIEADVITKHSAGPQDYYYLQTLLAAEYHYLKLIENGWTAQQARSILPNSLKTELIMTGFALDWKHFFELRDSKAAHPQAFELANPLHQEFIKRNYVKIKNSRKY